MASKLFAVFFLFSLPTASAQVHVWQGTLTLPTYEEGAPDPTRHSINTRMAASIIPTPCVTI